MCKTVQQLMQYKLAVPNACVQMNQQQMYKTVCAYIMSSSIVFTVCTAQCSPQEYPHWRKGFCDRSLLHDNRSQVMKVVERTKACWDWYSSY